MSLIEIDEPISDTIADAVLSIGHRNEDGLEREFQVMLHSPLPWDVILLMGIYDYSKTTGLNLMGVNHSNKLEFAKKISRYPATMKEVLPGLTYMAELHDGIDDNEELTSAVLKSLIHILWLVVYRITGDERFVLGALSIAVSIEKSYLNHLELSLRHSQAYALQS